MEIDFEKSGYEILMKKDVDTKGAIVFGRKDESYVFVENKYDGDVFAYCLNLEQTYTKFIYGSDVYKKVLNKTKENGRVQIKEFLKTQKQEEPTAICPALIVEKDSSAYLDLQQFFSTESRDRIVIEKMFRSIHVVIFAVENGKLELIKDFMDGLKYEIIRGKGTIGNLIEVTYKNINILLELGKELDGEEESSEEQYVLSKEYDAILVSHYHLDHAGLVQKAKSKVYMGEKCLEILNKQLEYKHEKQLENISTFETEQPFFIKKGNFSLKITPFLTDHSAFDSYMFLIEGDKTLLYSGDFRSGGRKSFNAMIEKLPTKVDYLICEATNLYGKRTKSEYWVENKAIEVMKKYKRTFVFQAGTNIDRLVSIYKASRKTGKCLLLDNYVESIVEGLKNIPSAKNFNDVYWFWDARNRAYLEADFARLKKHNRLLGSTEIGETNHHQYKDISSFTMLVRPSMMEFLKRVDEDKRQRCGYSIFENAVLIYSLWSGYKQKEDVKKFLENMQELGVDVVNIHASGHADAYAIDRLKQRTNPTQIEYVHYVCVDNAKEN